jgi:hypothetical protein
MSGELSRERASQHAALAYRPAMNGNVLFFRQFLLYLFNSSRYNCVAQDLYAVFTVDQHAITVGGCLLMNN